MPIDLQDAIIRRLNEIFQNYAGIEGEINIYSQHVPKNIAVADSGDASTLSYPYVLVKLNEGESQLGDKGAVYADTSVVLIIGTKDGAADGQGYRDGGNIANRIIQEFSERPLFAKRYTCKQKIGWAALSYETNELLRGSTSHPYHFIGLTTDWEVPSIKARQDIADLV